MMSLLTTSLFVVVFAIIVILLDSLIISTSAASTTSTPITPTGSFPSTISIGSGLQFSDCASASICTSVLSHLGLTNSSTIVKSGFFLSSSSSSFAGIGLLRITLSHHRRASTTPSPQQGGSSSTATSTTTITATTTSTSTPLTTAFTETNLSTSSSSSSSSTTPQNESPSSSVPTSTTAPSSSTSISSSSSSSSSFFPLPCDTETGRILPHLKTQDEYFSNTTTIIPFFASCFLDLDNSYWDSMSSSSSSSSSSSTMSTPRNWLPREKWCSFSSDQVLSVVKSDILEFLHQLQQQSSGQQVTNRLPPEFQDFLRQSGSSSSSSPASLILASEKLSTVGVCGNLNAQQSEPSLKTTPRSFSVSSQVFAIRKQATGQQRQTVLESLRLSELDVDSASASPASKASFISLIPGVPAKIDLTTIPNVVNVSKDTNADEDSSFSSWCSTYSGMKMAYLTPLTSTSLQLQVVDSWGNPVVPSTASPSSTSTDLDRKTESQVQSILNDIKLTVAVSYGSLNTFPNSTISSEQNWEQQGSYGIFCVTENRHLWTYNASTASLRITGFSISLCSDSEVEGGTSIADKLLSLTSAATSKRSSATPQSDNGLSSSSAAAKRSENFKLLLTNALLARLASGSPVKLRLGLGHAQRKQSSVSSSSTSSFIVPVISNRLENCLSREFRIHAVRPSGLALVPGSALPWHVRTSLTSASSSSNSNNNNNNNNNNFLKQSMLQDPFTATWGTLGMPPRLSQSIAWMRAACSSCETGSSSTSSQVAPRHFSVPVAQDQFVFDSSGAGSGQVRLPHSVVVNAEIFLTDSQGILVRDKTREIVFGEGTSILPSSSIIISSNSSSNDTTIETWYVSCEAVMVNAESDDEDLEQDGDAQAILPDVFEGKVTSISSSSSSASSSSLSSTSSRPVSTGRWTPFPLSTEGSTSSSSKVVRAQVRFTLPVPATYLHVRQSSSGGPVSFDREVSFKIQCRASPSSSPPSSSNSDSVLHSSAVFHLETLGEYECNNLESAFDVANALSALDAVALNALVRSVEEDTDSTPLAAALSPPLVQVFLPSALAAESELAFSTSIAESGGSLPEGYLVDSQTPTTASFSSLPAQLQQQVKLRGAYDPRVGIPWFPDSGLTSWVLIPRTSYLNIPLGIMTAMAFGTSYAVTRRLVLALNKPICSSSVGKLETAMSDWVYALALNLTTSMTHSTVLGKGASSMFSTSSASSDGPAATTKTSGETSLLQSEAVAPRQSGFSLQHSATGARQTTKWTSCYGAGVETLEFVSLQCCQNDAVFLSQVTELTPSHQKSSYSTSRGNSFNGGGGFGGGSARSTSSSSSSTASDALFFIGLSDQTSCGVYVLGTLGPVMVSGAGVGGVIASIGICFYIWVLISGSTAEIKSWSDMSAVEQWRTSILHTIAPWIPAVHAYFNFGSTTYSAAIVFWVDIGFALFWYFALLLHIAGRWLGQGKTRSVPFKSTRFVYILAQVLLLAYSHFLIVNAFLWIAASLHINLALVPYASGYAVIAINMWLSVQYMASELEPSLITGRFPQHTMAAVDAALSCSYFNIIVTVFLIFVSQVAGLTPFMGVAAAFVIFLLLLLFNFSPGESIRLALQAQLEDSSTAAGGGGGGASGGGDGENKGSRLADFVRSFMGHHHVVVNDDDEYDADEEGEGNGMYYHDDAGEIFDSNDNNNDDNEQEMALLGTNNDDYDASMANRKASRISHQGSNSARQQQSNSKSTLHGIDPELAARLMTTVPKLINLASGGKGASAGGVGGLSATDIANATRLVGTLQSFVGGGGGAAASSTAASSSSSSSTSVANNNNNNQQHLNSLNTILNTISSSGTLDPQQQALLLGVQMAANAAARNGTGIGGAKPSSSSSSKQHQSTSNSTIENTANAPSVFSSSPSPSSPSSSSSTQQHQQQHTSLSAEDLATLLQAVNAVSAVSPTSSGSNSVSALAARGAGGGGAGRARPHQLGQTNVNNSFGSNGMILQNTSNLSAAGGGGINNSSFAFSPSFSGNNALIHNSNNSSNNNNNNNFGVNLRGRSLSRRGNSMTRRNTFLNQNLSHGRSNGSFAGGTPPRGGVTGTGGTNLDILDI